MSPDIRAAARRISSVVVAPNCLRGHATSVQVADALAVGVRRALPHARVTVLPLADGGDGTLAVLHEVLGGRLMPVTAQDVLGRGQRTSWLGLDSGTAVVETASICGLGGTNPRHLRPLTASSAGVGTVIAHAIAKGAKVLLLALGGTAVVDGGAGALHALGARFLDSSGKRVVPVPSTLREVARIDLAPARRLLDGVTLRLLPDVRPSLAENLAFFGAQKGMTEQDRPIAAGALSQFTSLLAAAGDEAAPARFRRGWFGAGGGIGFGLAAAAEAEAKPGAEALLEMVDRTGAVGSADFAVTAEGKVDESTWRGKLPGTVAARRAADGLPTGVVAIRFAGRSPDPLISHYPVADPPPASPLTGAELWSGLADAAARACTPSAAVMPS
ncbi:glycerate kinase [Amycolatopsis halotolerans]|uniref:Glycerate kinase n=1 Tax=Amycolatopsis halotolerans TaxID=330083 RepID=A0ABV7QN20_9PSEU